MSVRDIRGAAVLQPGEDRVIPLFEVEPYRQDARRLANGQVEVSAAGLQHGLTIHVRPRQLDNGYWTGTLEYQFHRVFELKSDAVDVEGTRVVLDLPEFVVHEDRLELPPSASGKWSIVLEDRHSPAARLVLRFSEHRDAVDPAAEPFQIPYLRPSLVALDDDSRDSGHPDR